MDVMATRAIRNRTSPIEKRPVSNVLFVAPLPMRRMPRKVRPFKIKYRTVSPGDWDVVVLANIPEKGLFRAMMPPLMRKIVSVVTAKTASV